MTGKGKEKRADVDDGTKQALMTGFFACGGPGDAQIFSPAAGQPGYTQSNGRQRAQAANKVLD